MYMESNCKYKWVDGQRYIATYSDYDVDEPMPLRRIVWELCPLVSNNPFPRGVLHMIFANMPMYWLFIACNVVCKDWNAAIMAFPMVHWVERGNLEWKIELPVLCGPTMSARAYLKRMCASAKLLADMLCCNEPKTSQGKSPSKSYLLSKGLPFPAARRGLKGLLETYMDHLSLQRNGLGPSSTITQRVIHNFGPFEVTEFFQNKNRSDESAWQHYVDKLLHTIRFLPFEEEQQLDESNRSTKLTLYRKQSAFITQLSLFLRDKFEARVILSDRFNLMYDREIECDLRNKMRQDEHRRMKMARATATLSKRNREHSEYAVVQQPKIKNIVYTLQLGYYVDLDTMINVSLLPVLANPVRVFTAEVQMPIPGRLGHYVSLLFFPTGKVIVSGFADPVFMPDLYESIKAYAEKFKMDTNEMDIVPDDQYGISEVNPATFYNN